MPHMVGAGPLGLAGLRLPSAHEATLPYLSFSASLPRQPVMFISHP